MEEKTLSGQGFGDPLNMDPAPKEDECLRAAKALGCAFNWGATIEGFTFWHLVHNKLLDYAALAKEEERQRLETNPPKITLTDLAEANTKDIAEQDRKYAEHVAYFDELDRIRDVEDQQPFDITFDSNLIDPHTVENVPSHILDAMPFDRIEGTCEIKPEKKKPDIMAITRKMSGGG
jgi:hypothetical protein